MTSAEQISRLQGVPLARDVQPAGAPAAGPRARLLGARPGPRHLALVVVLGISALLNTHRLSQNGYANIYYSAGVRSMLRSLHNFFFVSFDPSGLVSVDKPPLGLWVEAASAKLFGFSPMSLLLPEAIMGVLGVALLYRLIARRFGPVAGIASALALAVFPSFVAVSRDTGVDPLLILLMLLACGAGIRAAETGRWRSLIACGLLVGLAFNTKTLAAYLAVPPIALAFLICAPGSLLRRSGQLLVAGLVMLAVSFSWMAVVELTPASKRPFVGSSTNNTQLGLTFEYNGLGRVGGQTGGPGHIPHGTGALAHYRLTVTPAERSEPIAGRLTPKGPRGPVRLAAKPRPAASSTPRRSSQPVAFPGHTGLLRLFGRGLGDQGGWIVPLALFGLIGILLALVSERRSLKPAGGGGGAGSGARAACGAGGAGGASGTRAGGGADAQGEAGAADGAGAASGARAGGEDAWEAPGGAPPPPRDVSGPVPASPRSESPTGMAESLRRDPRLAATIVLGGWFLVEAAVLSLSKGIVHPYYISALAPGAAAMAGAGAVAFVELASGRRDWRLLVIALGVAGTVVGQLVILHDERYMQWFEPVLFGAAAVGLAAIFLAAVLGVRNLARGAMAFIFCALLVAPTAYASTTWLAPVEGTFPAAGPTQTAGTGGLGFSPAHMEIVDALLAYVTSHSPGSRWIVLTDAANTAAPMILLGYDAGSLAGYSGTDPALDGPGLARLVARGEARYVLLGGQFSSRGGNRATAAVLRACRQIPPAAWHDPAVSPLGLVPYDCAGRERALSSG
jgi:4-amino-4-deoxy-L-arabinose transferase-like glycosyltransferase